MALKDLDRLSRSKKNSEVADQPPVFDYTAMNPIYDRRLSIEERKARGLGHGMFMNWPLMRELEISVDDAVDIWLEDPVAAVKAADWRLNSADRYHHVFKRFAIHSWHLGWNPIPETRSRVPGQYVQPEWIEENQLRGKPRIHRKRIQVLPSLLWDRRRTKLEMWTMVNGCDPTDNMAMTIGEACGNVRVWDLDIKDQELAEAVHSLMDEVFGKSPFVRVGNFPKRQIIYRTQDPQLLELVKQAFEILSPEGTPDTEEKVDDEGMRTQVPRNVIEFLARTSNFTCYGIHHKTGSYYDWSLGTLHPAIAGPEHAPLITADQITLFLERLKEIRPFKRRGSSSSSPFGASDDEVTSFARSDDGRIWVPRVSKGQWSVNEAGLVYDGREPYATKMAWVFAAANPHMLLNAEDREVLRDAYYGFVMLTIVGDKIKKKPAIKTMKPRWESACSKLVPSVLHHEKTGEWLQGAFPYRVREDGSRPCAQHIAPAHRPADGSLDWLPQTGGIIPELAGRSRIDGIIVHPKPPEQIKIDRQCRQLIEGTVDRQAIHDRVAAEIDAAYDKMLAEVLEREQTTPSPDEIVPMLPLHILGGPTGSGKTTRGIRRIGAWCKANPRRVGAVDHGPIVIAVPTGENLEEALRTAERNGMIVPKPEMDIDEIAAELEANGIKVAVIRGKRVAGCQRIEEVEMLSKKGMSSARLCGARVPQGTELEQQYTRKAGKKVQHEEVLCPVRAADECGYWNQMDNAEDADIVLVPHAYLTTKGVPPVIKSPRAVFIDESITYRVLHQIRMPISGLTEPRGYPWLTKEEKEAGVKAEEVHHFSEVARDIATKALLAGRCPAADLAKDPRGPDYVDAAIKVCDRNHRDAKEVLPTLTAEQIAAIAARENGTNLSEETRFWRIVKERVQALVMDEYEPLPTPRAKGKREMRLQVVHVTVEGNSVPFVRISWRSEPNWSAAPMMLLDASASPKIMSKVFSREIVRHDISAPLHVRTVAMVDSAFSNSSFIPREGASDDQIKVCQFNVVRARALITKVAVSYSYGMVLVGMAMPVREVIFAADWTPPPNVETVHFGALRGLDFAKNYVAALSIGRSEQPVHIIDGYAAALSYDDDEPELPHDKLGTGVDDDGKPVFRVKRERIMQMRTGEDYGLEVPEMPSVWGEELEEQWREEEQRQFVGRLRPVYRMSDAPTWICMTKCMPEGFIIDDVVALDDTLQDAAVWSVLKRCHGVLAPGLTDKLDWAQRIIGNKPMVEWLGEKLPTDKAFQSRMGQTLYEARYSIGSTKYVGRIAGWHTDPHAAFQALVDAVGVTVTGLEIQPLVKERVVGDRRRPDRLAVDLAAAREARAAEKKEQADREYVELVHSLLPAEEGVTVVELLARHNAGQNIEDLLICWLQSWHEHRDTITREEVVAEWEEIKATKTTADIYEMFGIGGCVAAE